MNVEWILLPVAVAASSLLVIDSRPLVLRCIGFLLLFGGIAGVWAVVYAVVVAEEREQAECLSRGQEYLTHAVHTAERWGQYAAAIHRWENLTRPAPPPTETGPKGNPRLSPAFTEWMMGLPAGWITDTPGVTRNEALKLCGNGVVPAQAEAAIRFLLGVIEGRAAA